MATGAKKKERGVKTEQRDQGGLMLLSNITQEKHICAHTYFSLL